MRKLNLRYLWTALAAAALTAAAITIPAWAAGGGGSSGQTQSQSESSGAPLPPPPGVTFSFRGKAPGTAELKESRAKLDKYASCLKDNGFDVPAPAHPTSGRAPEPPRPPSQAEMKKMRSACGTPPAPPAFLPPLDKKHIEAARKAMANSNCPPLPAPPARSGDSDLRPGAPHGPGAAVRERPPQPSRRTTAKCSSPFFF